MVATIQFPIPDTENGHYDYGRNLSKEEYSDFFLDDFHRRENDMRQVEYAIQYGNRANSLQRRYNIWEIKKDKDGKEFVIENADKLQWIENEVEALDINYMPLTANYLQNKNDSKEMDIFQINFKYNDMNYDLESELRFWSEDSLLVRRDKKLDSKTRIKRLPDRDMKLALDGNIYRLYRCKIVKDISDNRNPFNWSLLVNKIEKEN